MYQINAELKERLEDALEIASNRINTLCDGDMCSKCERTYGYCIITKLDALRDDLKRGEHGRA